MVSRGKVPGRLACLNNFYYTITSILHSLINQPIKPKFSFFKVCVYFFTYHMFLFLKNRQTQNMVGVVAKKSCREWWHGVFTDSDTGHITYKRWSVCSVESLYGVKRTTDNCFWIWSRENSENCFCFFTKNAIYRADILMKQIFFAPMTCFTLKTFQCIFKTEG